MQGQSRDKPALSPQPIVPDCEIGYEIELCGNVQFIEPDAEYVHPSQPGREVTKLVTVAMQTHPVSTFTQASPVAVG